jgi:hypothetical protein
MARSPELASWTTEHRKAVEDRLKAFVPVPAAIAYLREGLIYLHTWSQVWDGLRFLSEPVKVLAPSNPTELGRQVLETLEAYNFVEHQPATFSGITKPLQKAANVRSEKAFYAPPHKRLQIELKQGRAVFTPHKEVGREYKLQEDKARESSLEPEAIGKKLLEVLETAEWSYEA